MAPTAATIIAFTTVKGPYGWLGNMSPHPIDNHGTIWATSEALFQALRFPVYSGIRELIQSAKSPMAAKLVAQLHADKMRSPPRDQADVDRMALVLGFKITSHLHLKRELLASGDALLVEDVTKRRQSESTLFWGARLVSPGVWEGQNQLGKLWMELRTELRAQDPFVGTLMDVLGSLNPGEKP